MERIFSLLTHGFKIWPYLILLSFYSTVFLTPRPYKKYMLYAVIGWVIFFGGFKDVMTPDLVIYQSMYKNYNDLSPLHVEPFYIFLSWVLNKAGASFYVLSSIYFFLTVVSVILALRNLTRYVEHAFFIWLTTPGFFLNTFIEMRQMLSVAFFLLAVSFLIREHRESLSRSGLFFVLSVLTHYSSVFVIPVFFIARKVASRKYPFVFYIVLLFFGFAMGAFGLTARLIKAAELVIPQKYLHYLSYGANVPLLKIGVYISFALLLVVLSRHVSKSCRINSLLLNLFVVGVFILVASPSHEISREAYYFLILQTVLVPNMLHSLKIKFYEEKVILTYMFTMFYIIQYIYGLFLAMPEGTENFIFIPYKNVFFGTLK